MDIESTLSTIAQQLPEEITHVISHASAYIPEDVGRVIKHASSYFPKVPDLVSAAEFMLYFTAASLILGVLGRIILGKRSSLNHALSSVMGILFVYALTVVIYSLKPWNLELLLAPLPFTVFAGEYLILLPIADMAFPALCTEILSLVILAFLVNLTDTIMPKGNSWIAWYLLRFLTVILSIGLQIAARWAIHTFLPEVLVTYSPAVLLGLLIFMVFSGVISLILGLFITITSPFLGAMYTFFFSNILGKQVSKAIFTSAILCGIIYVLGLFGYTVIPITAAVLIAYIPLALLMLLLWYLIGHTL